MNFWKIFKKKSILQLREQSLIFLDEIQESEGIPGGISNGIPRTFFVRISTRFLKDSLEYFLNKMSERMFEGIMREARHGKFSDIVPDTFLKKPERIY